MAIQPPVCQSRRAVLLSAGGTRFQRGDRSGPAIAAVKIPYGNRVL